MLSHQLTLPGKKSSGLCHVSHIINDEPWLPTEMPLQLVDFSLLAALHFAGHAA